MHVMCCGVECSILILDTIFDNKYHGIFHMEFQQNPDGLVPWNPDDKLAEASANSDSMDSTWNT